jgi:hypothetical protein
MIENPGAPEAQNIVDRLRDEIQKTEESLANKVKELQVAEEQLAQEVGITRPERLQRLVKIDARFNNINEILKLSSMGALVTPLIATVGAMMTNDMSTIEGRDMANWIIQTGTAPSGAALAIAGLVWIRSKLARRREINELYKMPEKKI